MLGVEFAMLVVLVDGSSKSIDAPWVKHIAAGRQDRVGHMTALSPNTIASQQAVTDGGTKST